MKGALPPEHDLPKVHPPVGKLLMAIGVVGGASAILTAGAVWLITGSAESAGRTAVAGAVAMASGWAGSLAVMPWKARRAMVWPMLALLSTLLVMVFTLSAGLVLHFAARVAEAVPWIGLVAGFWAVLAAMVGVHAGFLRSLDTAGDARASRAAGEDEQGKSETATR